MGTKQSVPCKVVGGSIVVAGSRAVTIFPALVSFTEVANFGVVTGSNVFLLWRLIEMLFLIIKRSFIHSGTMTSLFTKSDKPFHSKTVSALHT